MNPYETFRWAVLKKAKFGDGNQPIHVKITQLASQFGIPTAHVREQLLDMEQAGLVELSAWDGQDVCLHGDWLDDDSFFYNTTDRGHIRIRLLTRGAELLLEESKTRIGFAV